MASNPFAAAAATSSATTLQSGPNGGFVPAHAHRNVGDGFAAEAHMAFEEFVTRQEFPCVGARAAFNSGSHVIGVYDELGSAGATAELAQDLFEFTRSGLREASDYATFVTVFREPASTTEVEFEERLWQLLRELNRLDARHFDWDPMVRSDPADPQFSFSFAGQALYVIGLHANSSRIARQFRWPTLVFNPHEQFERLRADGKWKRMQETIRERDRQLQGGINPMLSDFGTATEARQYSGRAVEEDWRAPFAVANPAHSPAGKCPFHR